MCQATDVLWLWDGVEEEGANWDVAGGGIIFADGDVIAV